MKFWSTSEIDSDIVDEFRIIRNALEKNINEIIQVNSYGESVDTFDTIYVVSKSTNTQGKEKYFPKKKEIELYVIIDYNSFIIATSSKEKTKILINELTDSLSNLSKKYNFGDELIKDIKVLL